MEHTTEASEGATVMPPPIAAVVPGVVIACELPCMHCGYDLRTMRLDALCPECGRACAEALAGLAAARGDDLARVRRGVVLMLVAALLPMFVVGFGILGLLLEMFGQSSLIRFGDDVYPWVIGLACAVVGPIVALGGVFRLTESIRPEVDNGLPSPHPGEGTMQGLRYLAGAYVLASITAFAFWMYMFQSFSPSPATAWGAAVSLALAPLTWTARNVVTCRFLATILRLGSAPKLARWFRVLSWFAAAMFGFAALVSGAVLLLYLFHEWFDAFDTGGPGSWNGAIFVVVSVAYSLGSLSLLAWSIVWPISLVLVVRRIRALERAVAARVGSIVSLIERPASL